MKPSSAHHRPLRHRLVTLGRLTLLGPDGTEDPSLGTRRRKLAVLAYLAIRARPVTRDHLAALFWGGRDDDRARNSLSDALSHLRRVLGRDAIVAKGDEVALAADAALVVDALELREAVDAGDWARATTLHAGPFLDGVHVDDAPEFELWRTTQAERLRLLFTQASAPHARALADARQWEACAEVAARWLAVEPASKDAALHRLGALAAPGTSEARTAALADYERLCVRLAEELDIGVDPCVQQLAASIRAELPRVTMPPVTMPPVTMPPGTMPPGTMPPVSIGPEASAPGVPIARAIATAATPPRRSRAALGGLLAALAMIVGAAAWGARPPATDTAPVVAVLPFENVGATGDAYFAEGLTGEVRARLTGISGLRVIGGASARRYAGSTRPAREIARELGATHLLTGSVRWERTPDGRGRVRVSPELVRADDQASVWAERIDGSLDEVFAMQATVAERVASALDVTLLAREGREVMARPTTNLAAYDAYLRGRNGVSSATTFSAADRRAILAEFERAVALDPTFAAAHVELAWAHLRDHSQAGDPAAAAAALAKFQATARRAWALDTMRVEARLLQAHYLETMGDRAGADRLVRATARIAPGNVEVLGELGEVEWRAGRHDAAIAAYRRAMALDPRATRSWSSLPGRLDRLHRYEEAIAVREHEIEVTPNSDVAYAVQAASHLLWRGDTAAARRTLDRASLALPWVVRLPGGVAGISIWTHALPPAVLHARDTLTLAGYLAGAGGIAPELHHLVKLRHHRQSGRGELARAHADSLVARLEPLVRASGDAPWFFWWFSRRSVLAEAYATIGRQGDAARTTDDYVAETRRGRTSLAGIDPERLCHALHNAAYVDVLTGQGDVAVARLGEALGLPCGHRLSRALLRADPAWAPLRGMPAFERMVARGP